MEGLSLFSGIGGLDIAAQMCGIEPVALCEIEPFPVEILKKRFPGVPILPDVRKVNGHDFGTVDVVFGGFPCQDLSQAGRRAGLLDADGNATRSGLWFEMLRIISEARPRFVVAENVRGAINAALDVVKSGLEGEGYEVRAVLLPASAFGAPHQRERIFILAVRNDVFGCLADCDGEGLPWGKETGNDFEEGQKSVRDYKGSCTEDTYLRRAVNGFPNCLNNQVAHYERNWPTCTASSNERTGSTQYKEGSMHSANLYQIVDLTERAEGKQRKGQLNPAWVEQLMGYPDGWTDPDCDEPTPWMGWPAPPNARMWMTPHAVTVGMTARTTGRPIEKTTILNSQVYAQEHGITEKTGQYPYEHPRTVVGMKNRAKRLKALGNSVVPQQAEPIFRTVQMIDELTRRK